MDAAVIGKTFKEVYRMKVQHDTGIHTRIVKVATASAAPAGDLQQTMSRTKKFNARASKRGLVMSTHE